MDTVTHCGHTLEGEFLRTLTGTERSPGGTMLRTIRNNAFIHIHGGLEWILKHAPIPVTGSTSTTSSEFMNWAVITWCDKQAIPVTRSRPYKHNDNAHVRTAQRRLGHAATPSLPLPRPTPNSRYSNALWDLVGRARKNHLLPAA
ncbi:MAG: hypothetical protein IPH27_16520 [Actinomycetales bacterium]|nr:hypothetical protein [Candidatus Phosphoribacter baldrii]